MGVDSWIGQRHPGVGIAQDLATGSTRLLEVLPHFWCRCGRMLCTKGALSAVQSAGQQDFRFAWARDAPNRSCALTLNSGFRADSRALSRKRARALVTLASPSTLRTTQHRPGCARGVCQRSLCRLASGFHFWCWSQ